MESCAISQRATVLGQKWWVLAVCLVRAAGHRPCSVPLSSMPLGIVVVGVCCCRRCHGSSLSLLCCRLATPCAIVHHHCTVMPLSRRWIRCRCLPPLSLLCRRHLPPLSLLHHLRCCTVRHCCRGAIGCHRRTIFASPGPPLSPLGIAMPCTRHQW